jgi:hypothetical protein
METDVWRRAVMLRGEGWAIELAFDEGEIAPACEAVPVCDSNTNSSKARSSRSLRAAAEGVAQHGLWLAVSRPTRRLLARGRAAQPRTSSRRAVGTRDGAHAVASAGPLHCDTARPTPPRWPVATQSQHVHQPRGDPAPTLRSDGRAADRARWRAGQLPRWSMRFALGAGRDEVALLAVAPQLKAAVRLAPIGARAATTCRALGCARIVGVQQPLLALLVASRPPLGHDKGAAPTTPRAARAAAWRSC